MKKHTLNVGRNPEFQDELKIATKVLLRLTESNCTTSRMHDIFSFYVKFLVSQISLLNNSVQPLEICKTDRAFSDFWNLIMRAFIVNLITLINQFLSELQLQVGVNTSKDRKVKAIEEVIKICEDQMYGNIDILEEIKITIIKDQTIYLLKHIKAALKRKKISPKKDNMSNFFQALGVLRNYYAHFSMNITDKNDLKRPPVFGKKG